MKIIVSLFLVLIMLLSLCACGKNHDQNTDSGANTGHTTTKSTESPTADATEDTQAPTQELTTVPTKKPADSITLGTQAPTQELTTVPTKKPADSITLGTQAPTQELTTTPTKIPATTPPNNTQTTTDEPDENPTDEPSDCEHTYPTVTCTMPKMCTKCHHFAGNALPHNYQNGFCTVCGRAEMLETFREGYWVAHTVNAGTSEQGEVLSQYVLDPKLQHYSSYICYSNAAACTVSTGKIIYNNKGYHSDWYYTLYMGCTSKENGNTITVTVDGKNPYEFVLTKISETQLAVISSTNTAYVPVGIVFVKQ